MAMQAWAEWWIPVCPASRLVSGRGVCALVAGHQVAIFRVAPSGELFAVSNFDPFSGASVISRGIVGSKGDVVKVTSPMYKHAFDLRTGRSLDDPRVSLSTFDVRVLDGVVHVAVPDGAPTR